MHWIEISLKAEQEAGPDIASIFARVTEGTPVVEQKPDSTECTVRVYVTKSRSAKKNIERIHQELANLGSRYPELVIERDVDQQDWFAPIKASFTTLEVGSKLRIKASWAGAPVGQERHIIEIDPGYAFGTGVHPTTRMCLVELEKLLGPGMNVLDLGTGSGILAIAAARLGARHVLALDTDTNAVYAAARNVNNNRVQDIVEVKRGTLSLVRQRIQKSNYDVVVANIIAPVISNLALRFWHVLKPGGILIGSGMTEGGLDEVLISFALAGFALDGIDQDGEWRTIMARKPPRLENRHGSKIAGEDSKRRET